MNESFVDMDGSTVLLAEATQRGFVVSPTRIIRPITKHQSYVFERRRGALPASSFGWTRLQHTWINKAAPEDKTDD